MTVPEPPAPPPTVGTQPESAFAVNQLIGQHLRDFTRVKGIINQDHEWLLTADLTAAPYFFADDQQTLLKSAIADLDTTLDGHNMTFISRIIGLA